MKKIEKNICVIGAGYWGKNHIRALKKLNVLGGIVENNINTANSIEKIYPEVSVFNSLDEALQDEKLSRFTIATPAETHFELAKKILNAKKGLLVEKPFTLDFDEAEEIVGTAKKDKILIMVGHLMLFHPAIRKVKEMIDSGLIGRVQYIYSNRLNYGKVRTKEDAFWSLAPHDISIFQHISGEYPCEITSNGSYILQEGICDSTITKLKYENGIEGHIFVSWLHPFKEHRLVIIGSEAMISFEDSLDGKPLKLFSKKYEISGTFPVKKDGPVELIEYDNYEPLLEELSYFINLDNSSNNHIANGNHAMDVTKILVEASKQLEKNKK